MIHWTAFRDYWNSSNNLNHRSRLISLKIIGKFGSSCKVQTCAELTWPVLNLGVQPGYIQTSLTSLWTLVGLTCVRRNLSGANLSFANLDWANLSNANLSNANLKKASLTKAKLSEANLSGAILENAWLDGANLIKANLAGANLYQAYLVGVKLNGVILQGANLKQANMEGTDLSETDLTGVNLFWVYYDENTKWPSGFDPVAAGATLKIDSGYQDPGY